LEFLFRSSQGTQGSRDLDEVFVELREHARAMFHAGVAEIVMFAGDEGQRLVRTTVGLTPEPEVMVSTESPLTRMAIEAAAESPGVVLDGRSGVEGLNGNAMVARLAGEERPLGALVASNPKGVVSPFNRDHLR